MALSRPFKEDRPALRLLAVDKPTYQVRLPAVQTELSGQASGSTDQIIRSGFRQYRPNYQVGLLAVQTELSGQASGSTDRIIRSGFRQYRPDYQVRLPEYDREPEQFH